MSREQKLVKLIDGLGKSLSDRSITEALAILHQKLNEGVTEADEPLVKAAASTVSGDKRVFGQILAICKEVVSRGGGGLFSEWVIGIANSFPH